jgi:hypothetical protein
LLSFSAHSERALKARNNHKPPSAVELDFVLYSSEQLYDDARWTLEDDWLEYTGFLRAIERLDKASSPGWPLMREKPTIGEWLEWDGHRAGDVPLQRLWLMVKSVLKGEFEHLFRVFVKDEPHTIKKRDEGRWRLIIASSLPVQMVWQMTFSTMNDLEILKAGVLPSVQGYVSSGGGWKFFYKRCKTHNLTTCLDKSSWDWLAPAWVFQADLLLRYRLCNNPNPKWFQVATMLYRDAFADAKLLFSSGDVYQQQFGGFMKSGVLNTISTNSHCQVFIHLLASLRCGVTATGILACGDDTIQEPIVSPDYQDELEKAGCSVKICTDERIEFMGYEYGPEPEPLYFAKHVNSIATTKPDDLPDTLGSYARMYAYSDKFVFWQQLSARLGCAIPSREFCRYWFGSPLARVLTRVGGSKSV